MDTFTSLLTTVDKVYAILTNPKTVAGATAIYNRVDVTSKYNVEYEEEKRNLRGNLETIKFLMSSQNKNPLSQGAINELTLLMTDAEEFLKNDAVQRFKEIRYHLPGEYSPINKIKALNEKIRRAINPINENMNIENQTNQQANLDLIRRVEAIEEAAKNSCEMAENAFKKSSEAIEASENALKIAKQSHHSNHTIIKTDLNTTSNVTEDGKSNSNKSHEVVLKDEEGQLIEEDKDFDELSEPKKKIKIKTGEVRDPNYIKFIELAQQLTNKSHGFYEFDFGSQFVVRKTTTQSIASPKTLEQLLEEMIAGLKDEIVTDLFIDLCFDHINYEKVKVLCNFLENEIVSKNLRYFRLDLSCNGDQDLLARKDLELIIRSICEASQISHLYLVLSNRIVINNKIAFNMVTRICEDLPNLNCLSVDLQKCDVNQLLTAILEKYQSGANIDELDQSMLEGNEEKLKRIIFEASIKQLTRMDSERSEFGSEFGLENESDELAEEEVNKVIIHIEL